jgi:hypothetical protein
MKNVSDKLCIENRSTYFVLNNFLFFENHAFYEIMWKNIVQLSRPQMTIWHTRTARRILKDANIPTDCVTLIAFLPQKRFLERASVLRYTYIACLVEFGKQAHFKCGPEWP